MSVPRRIVSGADELPRPAIDAIGVCAISGKGRGVRALRALAPGEVIEVAPTIELSVAESQNMEQTPVGPYYFEHPLDVSAGLVVLGATSLVNHAEQPNAAVEWVLREGIGWFAVLRVIRPIATDEEITHLYQCPPWFDVVD